MTKIIKISVILKMIRLTVIAGLAMITSVIIAITQLIIIASEARW